MPKRISMTDWITRAELIHSHKYDYSDSIYTNSHADILIKCPHHGVFSQKAYTHLSGKGCSKCAKENLKNPRIGSTDKTATEIFIERAIGCHGTIYDYSAVDYQNVHIKVSIRCPQHGIFLVTPNNHITNMSGCPKCWDIRRGKSEIGKLRPGVGGRSPSDTMLVIQKFVELHGTKYDYTDIDYNGSRSKIGIICPDHGKFYQLPSAHLQGQGCSKCRSQTSIAEDAIFQFILDLGVEAHQSDREIISPQEIDIVIPQHKIAIEYCGIYWHSQLSGKKSPNYHRDKLNALNAKGYRLITIFENEWCDTPDIVKSRLRYMLGIHDRGVGARKLDIRTIDFPTARDFLNLHHIQGSTTQMSIRYAAFYNDVIVAVMAFSPPRIHMGRSDGHSELVRFATDGKNYPGIGSRLFTQYITDHKPSGIISYSDRRWSEGKFYNTIGFAKIQTSTPGYAYTKNYKSLLHRYAYRKSMLIKNYPDIDVTKSEWEIMQEMGYDRIWDCGTDRWEWTTNPTQVLSS